jgi:hypothetical protein
MPTRETENYKNGERCIVENCPFTDIDFHHTDYQKDLGIYVCHYHHFVNYHFDRVRLSQILTMMIERNIVKGDFYLEDYNISITRRPPKAPPISL